MLQYRKWVERLKNKIFGGIMKKKTLATIALSATMALFVGVGVSMATYNVDDVVTVSAETPHYEVDSIETDYPGYDEYQYELAEIGHNPYQLAALLTVLYEDYTESEVQSESQNIFEAQYESSNR